MDFGHLEAPVAKICDIAFTVRFTTVRRRKPSLRLGPIGYLKAPSKPRNPTWSSDGILAWSLNREALKRVSPRYTLSMTSSSSISTCPFSSLFFEQGGLRRFGIVRAG